MSSGRIQFYTSREIIEDTVNKDRKAMGTAGYWAVMSHKIQVDECLRRKPMICTQIRNN